MSNEIASTLPDEIHAMIEQLGGARIFSTAFKSCTYDVKHARERAVLVLKIAPALVKLIPGKPDHVIVSLGHSDTYTVQVVKAGKLNRRTWEFTENVITAETEGVHAPELRAVVEQHTGLRLTLGSMGR